MSQIILITDSSEGEAEKDDIVSEKKKNAEKEIKLKEEEVTPEKIDEKVIPEDASLNGDSSKPEETDESKIKATTEELFKKFSEYCSTFLNGNSNGEKITEYLQKTYQRASPTYKTSRRFRKLIEGYVFKLNRGSQAVAIYMNDVTMMLASHNSVTPERSSEKETNKVTVKRNQEGKSNTEDVVKKRRIKPETIEIPDPEEKAFVEPPEFTNGEESIENEEDKSSPSTSSHSKTPVTHDELRLNKRRTKKIKYCEKYLKKLSEEITKLQQRELSLEDLEKADSGYIQESLLKKRFMQIYEELCTMHKSRTATGRIIEQRITVRSSRFEEINKKVQLFINRPETKFPDFGDIFSLVRSANTKKQLKISKSQETSIAQNIFAEVGEKMQKRRHNDFIYEFGCSMVDKVKDVPDPAVQDKDLNEKLGNNRKLARLNLDAVIEKYSNLQYELQGSSASRQKEEEEEDSPNSIEDEAEMDADDSDSDKSVNGDQEEDSGKEDNSKESFELSEEKEEDVPLIDSVLSNNEKDKT